MPAAPIVEALAQAGGLPLLLSFSTRQQAAAFTGIERARFRRPGAARPRTAAAGRGAGLAAHRRPHGGARQRRRQAGGGGRAELPDVHRQRMERAPEPAVPAISPQLIMPSSRATPAEPHLHPSAAAHPAAPGAGELPHRLCGGGRRGAGRALRAAGARCWAARRGLGSHNLHLSLCLPGTLISVGDHNWIASLSPSIAARRGRRGDADRQPLPAHGHA